MDDEYYLLREIALLLKHKKNSEAAHLYEKLGYLFFKRNFHQKALAAYQKALSLSSEPHIYVALANIYEDLNQKFLAQEALSRVPPEPSQAPPAAPQLLEKPEENSLSPKDPPRGSPRNPPRNSKDEVIRALEKDLGIEIEAPPNVPPFHLKTPLEELSPESLYELAIGYKEMGLFEEAIEYLKRALSLTQDATFSPMCSHVLGLCYLQAERAFECISLLEKTLHQNLKLPKELRLELLYSLSQAYELSGTEGKALSCLRQIEKEDKFYRDIADRIKKIRSKNTF